MLTIGLLINPYAGIGGPLALKGSDGVDVSQALENGVECLSHERAAVALRGLQPYSCLLYTSPSPRDRG